MKRLQSALELQAATPTCQSQLVEGANFYLCPSVQTRRILTGTRYVNKVQCRSAPCQLRNGFVCGLYGGVASCRGMTRRLGCELLTSRPGDVRVSRRIPACQNLKQGFTRIRPGVQTENSHLITKPSTEVYWAIHSMSIGENSSLFLCFLLTTVVS
jgi:hypothetical protein